MIFFLHKIGISIRIIFPFRFSILSLCLVCLSREPFYMFLSFLILKCMSVLSINLSVPSYFIGILFILFSNFAWFSLLIQNNSVDVQIYTCLIFPVRLKIPLGQGLSLFDFQPRAMSSR